MRLNNYYCAFILLHPHHVDYLKVSLYFYISDINPNSYPHEHLRHTAAILLQGFFDLELVPERLVGLDNPPAVAFVYTADRTGGV